MNRQRLLLTVLITCCVAATAWVALITVVLLAARFAGTD